MVQVKITINTDMSTHVLKILREMQVIDGIDVNRFFAAVKTLYVDCLKDIELQWLVLQ